MHVICSHPNASNLINGVLFVPYKGANGTPVVVSEEISERVAKGFLANTELFSEFKGKVEEVAVAVKSFKNAHADEVRQPDIKKNSMIEELQRTLTAMQGQLSDANRRTIDLEEENRKLRDFIGEPNKDWTLVALRKYADMTHVVITEAMNKAEILEQLFPQGQQQEENAPPAPPQESEAPAPPVVQ